MNNYCTNCGERLEEKELVCRKCKTPIVETDSNFFKLNSTTKKILIIFSIFFFIIAFFGIMNVILFNNKVKKLEREYVIPYLDKYYDDYDIEYKSTGKCIVGGDCYFDLLRGCDGGACVEYIYLDEKECKSYYYTVTVKNEEDFIITVFYKDKKYGIVKGENITYSDMEDDIN